jgi:(hydroxyamino)benzene mutase
METQLVVDAQVRHLMAHGLLLFLMGLLNGVAVPRFKNPRMGLSAHLAGCQNGMVLLLFAFVWAKLNLSAVVLLTAFWMSVFSMWAIWFSLLLAAVWGTSRATPIAGAGFAANWVKELTVQALLGVGSLAIIVATVMMLWGLM